MLNTWSDEAPQQRERRLAMPELGEPRCPNGHDSAIPPKCPALMFVTCWHYSTQATWNELRSGQRPPTRICIAQNPTLSYRQGILSNYSDCGYWAKSVTRIRARDSVQGTY